MDLFVCVCVRRRPESDNKRHWFCFFKCALASPVLHLFFLLSLLLVAHLANRFPLSPSFFFFSFRVVRHVEVIHLLCWRFCSVFSCVFCCSVFFKKHFSGRLFACLYVGDMVHPGCALSLFYPSSCVWYALCVNQVTSRICFYPATMHDEKLHTEKHKWCLHVGSRRTGASGGERRVRVLRQKNVALSISLGARTTQAIRPRVTASPSLSLVLNSKGQLSDVDIVSCLA